MIGWVGAAVFHDKKNKQTNKFKYLRSFLLGVCTVSTMDVIARKNEGAAYSECSKRRAGDRERKKSKQTNKKKSELTLILAEVDKETTVERAAEGL